MGPGRGMEHPLSVWERDGFGARPDSGGVEGGLGVPSARGWVGDGQQSTGWKGQGSFTPESVFSTVPSASV